MNKTFFCDLSNVLLFFSRKKMMQRIATFCGLEEKEVETALFVEGRAEQYERGALTSQELYTYFNALSKKTLPLREFLYAASDIFEPNAPVIALVEELKKKGIRLILLSNTNEAHFRFVHARFPFLQLFNAYALSFEIKALKPEKAIFEHALKMTLSPKKDCFYTDDIKTYITVARTLGIDAEHYTSPNRLSLQLKKRGFL